MKAICKSAVLIVICCLPATVARAYDKSVHYTIVLLIAQRHGFTHPEAALIVNASQSLDDNDSTTAFSMSKLAAEAEDLKTKVANGSTGVQDGLVNLDHMRA